MTQVDSTKRTILTGAALTGCAMVVGGGAWTLLGAMQPSVDVVAAARFIVALDDIPVGKEVTVGYSKRPVIIRRRWPSEMPRDRDSVEYPIWDEYARNPNLDTYAFATDRNRTFGAKGEFAVFYGACTFDQCTVTALASDGVGWRCPCCNSHYDGTGVRRSGPGYFNLFIPKLTPLTGNRMEFLLPKYGMGSRLS